MKNKVIFFVVFAFVACFGGDSDSTTLKCLDRQTTQEQVECLVTATAHWDSVLNANYKVLMGKLDVGEKEKLKIAQRNWIAFRDKETDFLNQAFAWNPQTKGTIVKLYRAQYVMEVTKQRALILQNYSEAIEDSSKE